MKNSRKYQIVISLLFLSVLVFSFTMQSNSAPIKNTGFSNSADSSILEHKEKLKYISGIRSILHDSKGNYWFGSGREGVCFFDGNTFTYFTIEDGLSDNQVRTVQEDEHGTIWFGTGNGVSSYNGSEMISYTQNELSKLHELIVGNEWELTSKNLWFNAGYRAGVYVLNNETLHYLAFPVHDTMSYTNSYGVTDFSKTIDGSVWISTYSALFGFDGKSFNSINDESLGGINASEKLHIRSVLEDSKGNLWIGNNGIGVVLITEEGHVNFSKQKGLVQSSGFRGGNTSPKGTLEHVFEISEDSLGNIWFGDRDTGVWKYDGESMVNYVIDDKLSSQHIWEIYKDVNGDLLFGMSAGGVYVFEEDSFKRRF